MLDFLEEGIPLFGIVPVFVAQDAEGAGSVAELLCDFVGGKALDEKGPEGFILSMERFFRCEEKPCFRRFCYLISMIYPHDHIMLSPEVDVNRLCGNRWRTTRCCVIQWGALGGIRRQKRRVEENGVFGIG